MPTYILMTRLATRALHDAEGRRASARTWMDKVRSACPEVKWLAHYAILGPYDFMDVYEAPDEETAHKVSLISRAEGALTAESWGALPYERYLDLLGKIEPQA